MTFVKVRLAKIKSDATGDTEVVESFNNVINNLLKIDPRIVIHTWGAKAMVSYTKPISKTSTKPSTKDKMKDYVDQLFVRENTFPYIRIKIGHDIHRSEFSNESLNSNPVSYTHLTLPTICSV